MRMCFEVIVLLESIKQMSQYRVLRLMTVVVWKEEKRRTVAHIKAASCSWIKIGLKL